ncbi:MAG: efflux transporter outer membrane subunit [Thiopseudomonas sp.]|nr:efflux transporter outer membrane subunit [Thiopseudomonas sp.]
MKYNLLTLALAGVLAGCSMVPNYQQPAAPFAANWEQDASANAQVPDWQQFYRDANLQRLINTALEHNRDLRVAALNVEAFRAQYRIQRSALLPSVDASGSGTHQRIPDKASATGSAYTSHQYVAGIGVSAWELDFFGRIRSLKDSALQSYFASEQARRGAELSLVSSVAIAWFTLQADQQSLQLAEATLKTYQDSQRLIELSHDAGVASSLELQQARTATDGARVVVAQNQRQLAQSRNALQRILGAPLPELDEQAAQDSHNALAELPVALPSELLQRRPDIMQAEHQLKAANANIGAARAAFFPSISLTATAGSLSGELSDLFGSGTGTWLFQPQIHLPIFNAGRLKASLEYSEIQKNIQVAQYENAIQTAFQEVADGLVARTTYAAQLAAQDELLTSSQNYLDLADRRYREGIDNQLTLLDAQRLNFNARQQKIQTLLARQISEVNLYKALGGGFDNQAAAKQTN